MAENQHNEITGRLTLSYLSDSKETAELKYPDTEQCAIFFIYLYFMYDVIIKTRNSSGDEIANVNFLYDDIVHAVKIQ